MLKQIDIQNLQPGMVIVRVIQQNGPVKIKKSGLVTSQDMVQGLIEMGVQQIEVDLDQTVELDGEVPEIKKSATRKMLESNKATTNRIDDGLSEQFHRTLFLPSVQNIPSAWQFYTKRYLLAAFIALGGLALGWTSANYKDALTLLKAPPEPKTVSVSEPLTVATAPSAEQVVTEAQPLVNEEPQQNVTPVAVNTPTQHDTVPSNTENEMALADETARDLSESSDPAPKISADMLARFRKAVTEIEDSPAPSSPLENESISEDIPRIDQLPAWVMTRLPSMAFSAHMYATNEAERWVRVNGTRMVEGDKIDNLVEIVRIEPQHVILDYSGQTFSMAALTDW